MTYHDVRPQYDMFQPYILSENPVHPGSRPTAQRNTDRGKWASPVQSAPARNLPRINATTNDNVRLHTPSADGIEQTIRLMAKSTRNCENIGVPTVEQIPFRMNHDTWASSSPVVHNPHHSRSSCSSSDGIAPEWQYSNQVSRLMSQPIRDKSSCAMYHHAARHPSYVHATARPPFAPLLPLSSRSEVAMFRKKQNRVEKAVSTAEQSVHDDTNVVKTESLQENMQKTNSSLWDRESDELIRQVVKAAQAAAESVDWARVAPILGRSRIQCQVRWTEVLDPAIRKGKWSPQEDAKLRTGYTDFGPSWRKIADTLESRTQRQCRSRWLQMRHRMSGAAADVAEENPESFARAAAQVLE